MTRSILVLIMLFLIVPLLLGRIWTVKIPRYRGNPLSAWLFGWLTMLALYQVISIPFMMIRTSLTLLTRCFLAAAVLLCIYSLVCGRSWQAEKRWACSLRKHISLIAVITGLCILCQCVFVARMQHRDDDDAYYIATSTTTVETDSLFRYSPYTGAEADPAEFVRYKLASWPVFLASVSSLSKVHPAILAHTVLPALILMLIYIAFGLTGEFLFPGDREKKALFLLFVVWIAAFSGYSIYSAFTFMFARTWQGKAMLAGLGIPVLFLLCLNCFSYKKPEKPDLPSVLLMIAGAAAVCSLTMMSCAFSGLIIASFALVRSVSEKSRSYLAVGAVSCILPVVFFALMFV